jgi:molybdate transport system permease protein
MLNAEEWEALRLSLWVSGEATAIGLVLAIGLAWVLVRWQFRGKFLLDALFHLPLILPPVLIGFLLLQIFGAQGVLGIWLAEQVHLSFVFTTHGAALATGVMTFPLMLRAARQALTALDPRLEAVARSLGASAWDCFATISLPLAAPGLIAAGIMGFAASLGEFGAVITFAANIQGETRTLPLAIYSALQVPGGEASALRLSLLSLGLALTGLILSEALLRLSAARAGK